MNKNFNHITNFFGGFNNNRCAKEKANKYMATYLSGKAEDLDFMAETMRKLSKELMDNSLANPERLDMYINTINGAIDSFRSTEQEVKEHKELHKRQREYYLRKLKEVLGDMELEQDVSKKEKLEKEAIRLAEEYSFWK
nr:MAG TPA: hypothetical protein [Caudoviricetes sp.]